MEFPHKRPAQVPHFKTGPGYKLAKTWLPAVLVLQHCQLPPRMSRLNNRRRKITKKGRVSWSIIV